MQIVNTGKSKDIDPCASRRRGAGDRSVETRSGAPEGILELVGESGALDAAQEIMWDAWDPSATGKLVPGIGDG